jgi:hypothetical protein
MRPASGTARVRRSLHRRRGKSWISRRSSPHWSTPPVIGELSRCWESASNGGGKVFGSASRKSNLCSLSWRAHCGPRRTARFNARRHDHVLYRRSFGCGRGGRRLRSRRWTLLAVAAHGRRLISRKAKVMGELVEQRVVRRWDPKMARSSNRKAELKTFQVSSEPPG